MSLADVPGQERAKRFLQQLVRRDLVPHALLFSGMVGVGKAAVARQFTRLLNCQAPVHEDSCDRCPSCRKCEQGIHPDVTWIKRDGAYIKINRIRELQGKFKFAPFEGRKRVVVLEEAHTLSEEAGNALLKVLEEPPADHVLLLLSSEPQKLLQTMVSRCCRVRFQPLEAHWIAQSLAGSADVTTSAARRVARLCQGSMDTARAFTEGGTLSRWDELCKRLEALPGLTVPEFFKSVSQWLQSTDNLEQDLQCVRFWLRDVLLTLLAADYQPIFELNPGILQSFPGISPEVLFDVHDSLESASRDLTLNANKQLTLEGVCLAIRNISHGKSNRNPLP